MSRSYKKNPWVTDHHRRSTKKSKQLANRSFRRKIKQEEDMAARPQHRKYTDSWDICDYKWRESKKEAIQRYHEFTDEHYPYRKSFLINYPTLDSWLKTWEKYYRRK